MRVVAVIGATEEEPWLLPPARFVDRTRIAGGERTTLEVATAAAALGHEVELRGDLSRPDVDDICRAADVRLLLPPDARRPAGDDLVVLPEGYVVPEFYARVALSPARAVMLVLAVPGLFGPPLRPGFAPPEPLSVDPADVGRPEDYRAIRDAGYELWTNSPGVVDDAREAGVDCQWMGTGDPLGYPQPGERRYDVAIVTANRWSPLAREVVDGLDARVLEIPELERPDVLVALGTARVFVHPAVVEGQSRLQIEARAMGAVPLGLRSNRYVAGMVEGGGIEVDSLEEMGREVRRLLATPDELAERSAHAMRSARQQVDWTAFLERLGELLDAPAPPDTGRVTRAALGEAVERVLDGVGEVRRHALDLEALTRDLRAAVGWLENKVTRSEQRAEALEERVVRLRDAESRLTRERDEAVDLATSLQRRRSIRLADRLGALLGRRDGRSEADR